LIGEKKKRVEAAEGGGLLKRGGGSGQILKKKAKKSKHLQKSNRSIKRGSVSKARRNGEIWGDRDAGAN